jgi:hypothetical protein
VSAKEGVLTHREDSATAASAYNRLFPPSGAMVYQVTVATGMGHILHDVEAVTGDRAAELALERFPGAKVAHVTPAPQKLAA